ncbi:MAG: hypothetical protein V1781_07760 [Bacteroidota bacterium]
MMKGIIKKRIILLNKKTNFMQPLPIRIFSIVMSVTYILLGILFISTNFADDLLSEILWRNVMGIVLILYGIFRIVFLVRKLKRKK